MTVRLPRAVLLLLTMACACKGEGSDKNQERQTPPAPEAAAQAPARDLGKDARPAALAEPPSEIVAPFTIANAGQEIVYEAGCLTGTAPWTVVVPKAGIELCKADNNDNVAMRLEMQVCDSPTCPVPAAGTTLESRVHILDPPFFEGGASVTIVRHEKPYLVIHIDAEGGDEGAFTSILGTMRVLVPSTADVDATTWR